MTAKFLRDREVAERYSVGRARIWEWAKAGNGFPQPYRLGRRVTRWSLDDLEQYERKLRGVEDSA